MFQGFAHVWTPVVLARALKRKPMSITLAPPGVKALEPL